MVGVICPASPPPIEKRVQKLGWAGDQFPLSYTFRWPVLKWRHRGLTRGLLYRDVTLRQGVEKHLNVLFARRIFLQRLCENSNLFKLLERDTEHVTRKIGPLYFIFAIVKKLTIFLARFLHFKWFLLALLFLILMFMLYLFERLPSKIF